MLMRVLAAEHRDRAVRINTLLLATLVHTRSRPDGPPGSISADDAGAHAVRLLDGDARGETVIVPAPAA
jgi:hypothetical protein